MSEFIVYLQLGFKHILDLQGYDHILFILTISAVYFIADWKKLLVLVTAFTIGHSVTLALSVLDFVKFNATIVELLIPITILVTAIYNLFFKNEKSSQKGRYFMALSFGLIHGLGFSNYLKSLLGRDESILKQLFAFNVGLELGQLLIVFFILILSFIFVRLCRVKKTVWTLLISGFAAIISLVMIFEKLMS